MRERPVSEIVKQSASASHYSIFFAYIVVSAQQIERASHKVHHAYRVSEAAMFRSLISEHRESKLFDAAKALKLG